MSDTLAQRIMRELREVIALRHDLHAHPELSRREHRTAVKVREALAGVPGLEVLPPLMETDVVAVLNGDREGPCVALRADLDALPIGEETGLDYASTVENVIR